MNWPNTKMILAGPGTGKTTKVVNEFLLGRALNNVLVLSFTNATIKDLLKSFSENNIAISSSNCMNLYQYALKINFITGNNHILNESEEKCLEMYSKKLEINLTDLHHSLDCLTFREMITSCTHFIKNNPVLAKNKIGDIDLLIVDEYQDFNEDERALVNQIALISKETLILGDDDQSIYDFKNADPQGIIDLYNDKSVSKLAHENMCYRCPQDVVLACSNLIKNNKFRVDKEWKVCDKKPTKGIVFNQFLNDKETNEFIVNTVKQILSDKPDSTIMVLSPTRHLVPSLIEELETNKIDYVNWFKPISDNQRQKRIWCLKTIFGDKRLLNLMFYISDLIKDNKLGKSVLAIIKNGLQTGENREAILQKILNVGIVDQTMSSEVSKIPSVDQFVSDHQEYLEFKDTLTEDDDRNTKLEKIDDGKNQIEFNKGLVNIMTIHKSKGLQAENVFIIGLTEGILPHETKGVDSLEAQRREMFVAMSRVKEKLYLVTTVEINKTIAHKFDIKKFKFDYQKSKNYLGQTSLFISQLNLSKLI